MNYEMKVAEVLGVSLRAVEVLRSDKSSTDDILEIYAECPELFEFFDESQDAFGNYQLATFANPYIVSDGENGSGMFLDKDTGSLRILEHGRARVPFKGHNAPQVTVAGWIEYDASDPTNWEQIEIEVIHIELEGGHEAESLLLGRMSKGEIVSPTLRIEPGQTYKADSIYEAIGEYMDWEN